MVQRFATRFQKEQKLKERGCSVCGDQCDKGIRIDWQKGNRFIGIFCSWECKDEGEKLYAEGSLRALGDLDSDDSDLDDAGDGRAFD